MNAYVEKLQSVYKEGYHDGERCGQQQVIDAAMVYMTRNGIQGHALVAFFHEINAILDEYTAAWNPSQEQDVIQARLDGEIEYGLDGAEVFLPFPKRYPEIKTLGYDKPIKEARHPVAKKKGKHR